MKASKYVPFLILLLTASSCATLFNNRNATVTVYSEQPLELIYDNDTLHTQRINTVNTLVLNVPKSKEPLRFKVKNDSADNDISLKSKISPAFYVNLALFPTGLIGMAVDLTNPKRYAYKSPVAINSRLQTDDTLKERLTAKLKEFPPQKIPQSFGKGDLYFGFSFPFIYPTQTTNKPSHFSRDSHFNILGQAVKTGYYYSEKRFIELSGSVSWMGDVGIGGDDFEDDERLNAYTLSLTHNHRFGMFSAGYGISYAYNDWWSHKYDVGGQLFNEEKGYYRQQVGILTKESRYSTLGFSLNAYSHLSKYFSVGIVYRPQLIRLKPRDNATFTYDHAISLDASFNIPLINKSGRKK
ncbi:MAG: hypothetical protein ACLVKO_08975 [Dysgonomonas sp.]